MLHYQPIVILESGDITGVEALVRWQHPPRGLCAPAQFIPLAEETGLILPLGAWVLREACDQAAAMAAGAAAAAPRWRDRQRVGPAAPERQFIADVRAPLATSGLEPHALILEFTGECAHRPTETVLTTLEALKAVGVRLAIDDFGTGYSSLSYLQQLPDRHPQDRQAVRRQCHGGVSAGRRQSPSARAGGHHPGRYLAVRTIAEGMKLPQQLDRLRELGCDLGQGFHFSKPLPAAQLEALLLRRGAPGTAGVRGHHRTREWRAWEQNAGWSWDTAVAGASRPSE